MKLISMTDFVLEQSKLTGYDISDYDWIIRIVNYANFLKQPLKLEMFVSDNKEKVLFKTKPQFDEGVIKHHISQGRNIEYLANFGSMELTQNATKQFL